MILMIVGLVVGFSILITMKVIQKKEKLKAQRLEEERKAEAERAKEKFMKELKTDTWEFPIKSFRTVCNSQNLTAVSSEADYQKAILL